MTRKCIFSCTQGPYMYMMKIPNTGYFFNSRLHGSQINTLRNSIQG